MAKPIFLFTVICVLILAPMSANAADMVNVDYFYHEPCGSCNTRNELLERFHQIAEEAAPGTDFRVVMHNTFSANEYELLQRRYDGHGVKAEHRSYSAIFSNEHMLIGSATDETISEFIDVVTSPAQDIFQKPDETNRTPDAAYGLERNQSEKPMLVYFYVTACADCLKSETALKQLPEDISVIKYNVAEETGLILSRLYFDTYKVPPESQRVPILFMGDKFFISADITLETVMEAAAGNALDTYLPVEGVTDMAVIDGELNLQWGGVILTGFLNGLNPCGLSMFLLFLSLIAAGRGSVLKRGFAYIAGKTATFFVIGLVGYHVFISMSGSFVPEINAAVRIVLAFIGFAVAAFYLSDYIAAKNERYQNIRLQLPGGLRRTIHRLIKRFNNYTGSSSKSAYVVILGSFLLGAAIAAGEFLCTGQIYVASIIYAIQNIGKVRVYMYFVVYVAAVMLPTALLLLFVWRGKTTLEISEIVRANMHRIKLASGIFFFVFSIYILVWN